jgi:hypothetical protein
MVRHHGSMRGRAIPLLIAAALLVFWGYIARWTTFRCEGDACVYREHRVLTFLLPRRTFLNRAALAAHPERLRVKVYDSNHNGADLVMDTADGELRIDEGNTATMNTRADELRTALEGSSLVDASVSPHPFGLSAMGVLAMIVLVGVVRLFKGGTPRPDRNLPHS